MLLRMQGGSNVLPLTTLLVVAFALRVSVGIARFFLNVPVLAVPSESWWESGYSLYGSMARNIAEGKGLGLVRADGELLLAPRPPLYPLLLAAQYRVFGGNSAVPILVQAAIGTGTVLLTYLGAKTIFGRRSAFVAAALAMGYPYFVVHDTALQETVLFTFLTAGALYYLMRAAQSGSLRDHSLAGLWTGMDVLCRESILPFVPLATLWLYCTCSALKGGRAPAKVGAFLMTMTIVVAPWLLRNTLIYGQPVLTTGEGFGPGFRLWVGYNPSTLVYYPWDSIDKSARLAYKGLSQGELAEIRRLGELERDRWFLRRAFEFIQNNPKTALKYAAVKLFAAFGPMISPTVGSWVRRALYTISYVPLITLAIIGGILARNRWPTLMVVYLLFLSFVAVVVATHAHTSHRSFLDVYLMILASYTLSWLLENRFRGKTRSADS